MKRLPNFSQADTEDFDFIDKFQGHYLDGKFDLHAGAGCNIFGYANEYFKQKLIENYHRTSSSFWKIKNSIWTELETALNEITDNRYSCYSCSLTGSDAVENAIKYMWYSSNSENKIILVRNSSYHSGTIAGWQMIADRSITEDWRKIKFVDFFDDLEEKVREIGEENIAGVLVDTVPWVGSLKQNDENYWSKFQKTITQYNLTLCVDEVLTGMGRMGHWLHSHSLGLEPDIVVLGKALSAGHENLSLTLVGERIQDQIRQKWLAIGNTRSNNTQGALIAVSVIEHMIETNRLDYIRTQIIPYCEKLNKLLRDKEIESYTAGAMVQAYPKNQKLFIEHLRSNGLYHNWNHFWHLPFYDISQEEMSRIINIIGGI